MIDPPLHIHKPLLCVFALIAPYARDLPFSFFSSPAYLLAHSLDHHHHISERWKQVDWSVRKKDETTLVVDGWDCKNQIALRQVSFLSSPSHPSIDDRVEHWQ